MFLLTQNLLEECKGFLLHDLVPLHLLDVCRRRRLVEAAVPSDRLLALTITCGWTVYLFVNRQNELSDQ